MQVLCSEGVANYTGPESCAGIREGVDEAFDRGEHRPAIEPRNRFVPDAHGVHLSEGNTGERDIRERRIYPAWSETLACVDASCTGTGRSHEPSGGSVLPIGPHREGEEPKPMTNGREKSHAAIVAAKPANKASASKPDAAELVEPRAACKRNAGGQNTHRTQSRERVSLALERVRQAARLRKKETLTSLYHHLSLGLCGGRPATVVPTAILVVAERQSCLNKQPSSSELERAPISW